MTESTSPRRNPRGNFDPDPAPARPNLHVVEGAPRPSDSLPYGRPLNAPHDRLPCDRDGKDPEVASPYWTARGENTRARMIALLGEDRIAAAAALLADDGEHRRAFGPRAYPGVFEHNALTLACALAYAEKGLRVVDLHGIEADGTATGRAENPKAPRGAAWQERASDDAKDIVRFWQGRGKYPQNPQGERYPYVPRQAPRNIGIATGGGIFALDVDPDGADWLQSKLDDLPETVMETTGRGGCHMLFRLPFGVTVYNSTHSIAPGVDIRGEGGQIACAPSLHENGNFYLWDDGYSPLEHEIAEAPAWLVEAAVAAGRDPKVSRKRTGKAAPGTRRKLDPAKIDAVGFEARIARIGDGDDHDGFDGAIYGAALSWFGANGWDADSSEMMEQLRTAILDAPCTDDRNERRYATDDYLVTRIEQARDFIASDDCEEVGDDLDDGQDRADAAPAAPAPETPSEKAKALFTKDSDAAAITKFMQKQLRLGIDVIERERVTEVLVLVTGLGKRVIGKLWSAADKAEATRAEKADPSLHKFVRVDQDDFKDQKAAAKKVILDYNAQRPSPAIYNSGGVLARIVQDRFTGAAQIDDLTEKALRTFLTDHGSFKKMVGDSGASVGVACPKEIAEQLLEEWDKDGYDHLEGVIAAPQYSATGDLIATPGYHRSSGLYYAPPPGLELPPVPETPSAEDVAEAVQRLRELFADFPFEDMTRDKLMAGAESADFAQVIGFALESIVRDLMGGSAIVPALLISKPSAGTGATLLLQLVQIILFGSTNIRPPSQDDVELAKEVFAELIAGSPMMAWDNVETVGGSVYPAMMTAPNFSGRVLGQSKTKKVRNRMSVAFTGNNPTFTKELRRRVVLCRLDAKMENPELRPADAFAIKNIKEHVSSNRGAYYHALLILVQNWLALGRPVPEDAPSLASYEGWAKTIGGILAAAGITGFLGNRDKVEEYTSGEGDDDPVRELVEWWLAESKGVGDRPSRVSLTGMFCKPNGGTTGALGLIDVAANNEIALPVKLTRHAEDAFGYDTTAFGRFMAKATGRVFDIDGARWCVVKGAKTKEGVSWNLERIGDAKKPA